MALFLIAPMIAVSIAPPAPPATSWEITPPTLKLPDCAAAMTDGRANVTIWPSTPPPTKPEMIFPTVPRSNVGDDLPVAAPPIAPTMRLIRISTILISHDLPICQFIRKQKCDFDSDQNANPPW